MGDFVKQQVEKGKEIYESLSYEKLAKLRILAAEIVAVQSDITSSINESGVGDVCRRCEGECCAEKHKDNIFDEYYFVFALIVLKGEVREEIMEVAKCLNMTPKCQFMGFADGCIIPDYARPHKCKEWFCVSTYEMIQIQHMFNDRLFDVFKIFREEVDRL